MRCTYEIRYSDTAQGDVEGAAGWFHGIGETGGFVAVFGGRRAGKGAVLIKGLNESDKKESF